MDMLTQKLSIVTCVTFDQYFFLANNYKNGNSSELFPARNFSLKDFSLTGNKREFTYVSGNPCDPNNPDGSEEEERERNGNNKSEEDAEENVPQNYPKRTNVAVQRPRPTQAPTTRAPTTVFQNRYNHQSLGQTSEEEDDGAIQFAQIPKTSPRPAFVQSTPRPRVQVIPQTTPAPTPVVYASPSITPSINITPKPLYRIQNSVLSLQQTQQPPATTYRPQTVSYVTPKPVYATTPSYINKAQGVTFSSGATRGAMDFDSEFKKFQQETGFQPVTPSPASQGTKSIKIQKGSNGQTSNPIYQTQLVYNPSSGQYDSALYQSIAQTDGEFQLNQRIQPYVQQQQYQQPQPQYQPQQQQAVQYRPPQQAAPQQQSHIPQQVYQRQQNEQQYANSQQLFAQQLQMQQSQLHRDRSEAAKKTQSPAQLPHRYQLQQAEQSPLLRGQQNGQQFYYLQPQAQQQSSGQIEAFLRGHNLEYQ
jgi:hypothetical protein